MKRFLCFLLLLSMLLCACGAEHICASPCPSCGLCTNPDCTDPVCAQKCPGHHLCTQVCSQCGLCMNSGCQEPACSAKCQGHHQCSDSCLQCGLCLNQDCTEPACAEKCPWHQEDPYVFPTGGYITEEAVTVVSDKLAFDIEPNIYVPGNLVELADLLTQTLEKVSGLSMDSSTFGTRLHRDGKVHVSVTREQLYVNYDWYTGLPTNESRVGFATAETHVAIGPNALFLGDSSTIVHELGHMLMYRQSEWSHCQLLDEGFAEYTSYLTLLDLEKNHPDEAIYFGYAKSCIFNMVIDDYDKLFEHPLEYWFENTFEYSGNVNYSIGFRFMWYLQEVYGDYTKWVAAHEQRSSSLSSSTWDSSVDVQISVLKECYGEDVLDNFYPWLQNRKFLFKNTEDLWVVDRTNASGFCLYPTFNAVEASARLNRNHYQDLYIGLETVKYYLGQYMGLDISGLKLVTDQPIAVSLYKADGSYTSVLLESEVSLEGISYIKLLGQGTIVRLGVAGFPGEVHLPATMS